MQTLKYQLGKIIGMFFLVAGSIVTLAVISSLFTDQEKIGEAIAGTFLIGVFPAVLGFLVWNSSKKNERKFLMSKYERQILEIASQNGGHLTPTELAMKTDLNLKESKKVLETMQIEGYSELKISSNGAIVFYFRELDKGDNYAESELLN